MKDINIPGFRNAAELKHYLYRSDAKIEMLYQQLSDKKSRKIIWEAKLGNDKASISRKAERLNDFDATDKMKAVVDVLFQQGQIGLIDQEGLPYISGTVKMRWGLYNDLGERPEDQPPLVYFSGLSNGVLVGLGGSSWHILGMYGLSATYSRSLTPTLVRWLLSGMKTGTRPGTHLRYQIPDEEGHYEDDHEDRDDLFPAMEPAHAALKPPSQELEFVAKVLHSGHTRLSGLPKDEDAHVVLGTPLYVAQVHPKSEDDDDPI